MVVAAPLGPGASGNRARPFHRSATLSSIAFDIPLLADW